MVFLHWDNIAIPLSVFGQSFLCHGVGGSFVEDATLFIKSQYCFNAVQSVGADQRTLHQTASGGQALSLHHLCRGRLLK